MGLAWISRHMIGLELHLGLMKILLIAGFLLMRSWFVADRRKMPLFPAHDRLKTFLVSEDQSIVDQLERSYEAIGDAGCGRRIRSAAQSSIALRTLERYT